MSDFNTFSDRGMKQIAAAVTRLKYQQQNLERQVRTIQTRADQNAVQVRTAITGATDAIPVYPTTGCHFPFTYYDLDFDSDAVNACPETDKREWAVQESGRSIGGEYIPPDTEVLFVEIPTPEGRRFWIWPILEQVRCRWLVAREHLKPGEQDKKAAFAVYDSDLDKWLDDGSDADGTLRIYDDVYHACVVKGEIVWCSPRPIDPVHNPDGLNWDVVESTGLMRRVKIDGDIACGATGTGTVWTNQTEASADCSGEETDPELHLDICNAGLGFHRKLFGPDAEGTAAAPQDYIYIGYDRNRTGLWHPIRDVRPVHAIATSPQDFCQDSTVSVGSVIYKDWKGPDCAAANDNIDTVDNSDSRLAGETGDILTLRWAEDNADNPTLAWAIVQVTHKAQDIVEDVEDAADQGQCPQLSRDRKTIVTMVSDACADPEGGTFLEFFPTAVTGNVYFDEGTCSFYAQPAFFCAPGQTVLGPSEKLNNGARMSVINNVTKSSTTDSQTGNVDYCAISMQSVDICALTAPEVSANQPEDIVFSMKRVVEDVYDTADALMQSVANHATLCFDSPEEEVIVDYTDCPDDT